MPKLLEAMLPGAPIESVWRAFIGCAAALAISTDATADRLVFTDLSWKTVAAPIVATGEVREVNLGELLFTQDLLAAREAIVPQTVTFTLPIRSRETVAYAAGFGFVEVSGDTLDQRTFCDRAIYERNGAKYRPCLLDRDADNVFDQVWWGGAINDDVFLPFHMSRPLQQRVSIPYDTRTGIVAERLMSAGPVVTRSPLGAYRLHFAVDNSPRPIVLTNEGAPTFSARPSSNNVDAAGIHFRDGDLPLTLSLVGARIEIRAITNGVVTYRVLSGFGPDPMLIAYSWSLPRE